MRGWSAEDGRRKQKPLTTNGPFALGGENASVAVMNGVVLSLNSQARSIDVTRSFPQQVVKHNALALGEIALLYPSDSLHVAVVDPGVGPF